MTTLVIAVAGIGVAVAGSRDGSMAVYKDGTVIDGAVVNGYIHVRANNVTIKNSTIRYGGASHAVRIFDGFSGTVVEDTKIHCGSARTNGLVFGNYTARRVQIFGCRNGFMYSDSAPATIVESTWNGKAVNAGAEIGPAPEPPPSESTATPSARPSASRTTAPPASSAPPREVAGRIPESFPGPDNTGVPAGTTLKASGSINATKDGQVFTGLDIKGCFTVTAKNVILRKSRISCGGLYSIRTLGGAANLLVEDVEINGQAKNSAAVCCGDYTLRRVEITNTIDGPRLGSNTVIENSWIHHLARTSGSHNDALQTTGASNIVVRGNSLETYNPTTGDPFNACIMIGSTTGPSVNNLTFEQNYCNGGNYSVGIREDLKGSNIQFRQNVFGRNYRFGVVARPGQAGISWDKASNVWVDNRKPVVP
ncbi:hypothetical protein [Micromonospora sp. NBC_01796]|uniref:hypothetical protein n=1 Tax=Micromonospora sp. NBC_01796 TaxID=2975987 RepID=UPI002DDAEC41|nr:hypothetical protein [Micromonospora sp. NBC_01796]WSA89437.1 hypothetical protein OIE47_18535 [Micromonospora sp. NBC_01796]